MGSVLLVNGGNYLYNLVLGRLLGPEAFADAALMVTLLLVLSFVGMTFQLTTAKFAVLFSHDQWQAFQQIMYRYALIIGCFAGALLVFFAGELQVVFNTATPSMFIIFGLGVPLYFLMSVNRGSYQGRQLFTKLSITYQTEMWSRLLLTLALLFVAPMHPSLLVALGIAFSCLFGLIPSDIKNLQWHQTKHLTPENLELVSRFIVLTACYELTQIMINNSDILLVKHFFDPTEAGLYASLALIGRVVYFVAWMFVMLLLPAVVQKHKDGEATTPVLFKYVGYVSLLSTTIVMASYLFPETIIELLFGEDYIDMAGLLWQYALATSLFAISNIFAYYFLSLDQYVPVILSGVLGVSQIILIVYFHDSLLEVVQAQIIAMVALLITQLIYFAKKTL
ncbi:oligosaccharide flippase family protein [Flavobacteriaceae bacterium TP-CH-4]|uniref:Oligosaccharide flippase family protein n=2 Tax=Pelagihabitans pacificus TaxID=2696054 RepID=A0A967AVX7_9FLAO|nr:oligosaccharide flippase family protein [Pelagihabitans pacificus]